MCCSSLKGYTCLGWLILSMVVAVIVLIVLTLMYIGLGGPFPTENIETSAVLLFITAVFTIVACIGCNVIITRIPQISKTNILMKWIIFAVPNVLLAFLIFSNLSALTLIGKEITVPDIKSYSYDYMAKHGTTPPGIKAFEKFTSGLDVKGVPFGCCGIEGFTDYLKNLDKCANRSGLVMIPDKEYPTACCVGGKCPEKKNKKYITYDGQSYVFQVFIKNASDKTDFGYIEKYAEDVGKEFSEWLSNSTIEDDDLPGKVGNFEFIPKYDCNYTMKKHYSEVIGNWTDETTWKNPDDKCEPPTRPKNEKCAARNYLEYVKKELDFNVYGCADMLGLFLEDNKFIQTVFDEKQKDLPVKIQVHSTVNGFHNGLIAIVSIFFILSIVDAVFFNYYYIPSIILPGKYDFLPFFPKAAPNDTIPASARSSAMQQQQPTSASIRSTKSSAASYRREEEY